MAKHVEVELNRDGVRELMQSKEMLAICKGLAYDAAARCGSGFSVNTYKGKTRVNAEVFAETHSARRENMKHNTILKALRGS